MLTQSHCSSQKSLSLDLRAAGCNLHLTGRSSSIENGLPLFGKRSEALQAVICGDDLHQEIYGTVDLALHYAQNYNMRPEQRSTTSSCVDSRIQFSKNTCAPIPQTVHRFSRDGWAHLRVIRVF